MKVKLIKKLILNNQLNIYLKDISYSYIIKVNKEFDNKKNYDFMTVAKGLLKKTYLFDIKIFNFLKFPLMIKFFKISSDLTKYFKEIVKKKLSSLILIKKNNYIHISQLFIKLQQRSLLSIISKIKFQISRLYRLFIFKYIIKKVNI